MQELNSSDNLWQATRPIAADRSLDLSAQVPPDVNQEDDGPDDPICCWNICSGIFSPTAAPRTRRKPASD